MILSARVPLFLALVARVICGFIPELSYVVPSSHNEKADYPDAEAQGAISSSSSGLSSSLSSSLSSGLSSSLIPSASASASGSAGNSNNPPNSNGQTYTVLTACEVPSKFTQSTTKISTFTTVEGYMSVNEIKLGPDHPAGVNLAAAMGAIVQSDSRWLLQNRVKTLDANFVTIIVRAANGSDIEVTVAFSDLPLTFGAICRWPSAFAAALLQAGYPNEYDGTSLASMSVPTAMTALTGLNTVVTMSGGSSAVTEDPASFLQETAPNIAGKYPTVVVTKQDGIQGSEKKNFAYPVLGWTLTGAWVYDVAEQKDFVTTAVRANAAFIYSLRGMVPSTNPNTALTYAWT